MKTKYYLASATSNDGETMVDMTIKAPDAASAQDALEKILTDLFGDRGFTVSAIVETDTKPPSATERADLFMRQSKEPT